MISVLDYTRKLLYEHDCVVLPELGGFLAYFSHAFYSEQNALYHAPQKRVAFNEALKLDDGLLTHYMTINEQITREEAQTRIRQFVEEVKNTIKDKGSFLLEGIGTLETNDEGKFQFEPTVDTNFYSEGFGLKSVAVATATPAILESSTNADWTSGDRAAEELELEVPRRRRSRIVMYIGGFLLVGTALVGGLTQLPTESLKSSLNPFELVTTVKGWLVSDKKSNTVREIAITSVEPRQQNPEVIVDEAVKPEVIVEPRQETSVQSVSSNETVKAEEKTIETPKKREENVVPSVSSDTNGEFLVIAGGFSKIENAQKLTAKLQSNGFESATILNPEPAEGKLIVVAAVACESSAKAKAQIEQVSRIAKAKAYVIHK